MNVAFIGFGDKNPARAIPFADATKSKKIQTKNILEPYYKAIKKLVDFPLISPGA